MSPHKLSPIAFLMLGVMLSGCQSTSPIVRSQSPSEPIPPQMNQPIQPTYGPVYYDGPASFGAPSCPPQHSHPNGAECPICAPQNFWMPNHHHTYDYRQPKDLVYPPQNQPAGVVVYPYYTCKGPADFFMK